MAELTAQRTLVKSPPELWAELSEIEGLLKHLGELGEIRITKVKPESTVAWEGEQISGTVKLEQSGWGTKVTFTAVLEDPEPEPVVEDEPVAEVEPDVAVDEPGPTVEAAADPEPLPPAAEAVQEPIAETPVETEASTEASPEPVVEETPAKRPGFFARWLFRQRQPAVEATPQEPVAEEPATVEVEAEVVETEPVAEEIVEAPEPEAIATPEAAEEPTVEEAEAVEDDEDADDPIAQAQAVLDTALENLGQAHHRPFSRG